MGWLRVTYKALIGGFALQGRGSNTIGPFNFKVWPFIPKAK